MELTIEHLTKKFRDKTAVDDVNLRLATGVWGLIGANGAGKTTLMRMVAGILTPTGGSVQLDGIDIRDLGESYRAVFGYLPQDFGFYPEFTVQDYLEYIAALKGLDAHLTKERIKGLLNMVGLWDVRGKHIRKLSGGQQRRIGIAQALLNDPKILVLDEPTSGLDPSERVHFRNILSELGQDKLVLISTHIVSDVEYIATRNAIMKAGKLVALGTTEELLEKAKGLVWESRMPPSAVDALDKQICKVNQRNEPDGTVAVRYVAEAPLTEDSVPMTPRLEDIYLWIFRDETAERGHLV